MPKPLQLAPFNVQQLSVYFIVNRLFTKSFNYVMLHLKKQTTTTKTVCAGSQTSAAAWYLDSVLLFSQ